jgi:hypothetical protein
MKWIAAGWVQLHPLPRETQQKERTATAHALWMMVRVRRETGADLLVVLCTVGHPDRTDSPTRVHSNLDVERSRCNQEGFRIYQVPIATIDPQTLAGERAPLDRPKVSGPVNGDHTWGFESDIEWDVLHCTPSSKSQLMPWSDASDASLCAIERWPVRVSRLPSVFGRVHVLRVA